MRNAVLYLTALIFGGSGLFVWLELGNNAAAPALLGGTIALTCLFYILSKR